MKTSVVVAVSGEDIHKLRGCLRSVRNFADEIVVFDLGVSGKEISEVMEGVNAKIVKAVKPKYIEVLRNKMVKSTAGDWILMLDPDERLTESLSNKLLKITDDNEYSVVNIPRKNIFFGKWIRHTSWWPDRQLRFFKRGSLRWMNTIHKYPIVGGEELILPAKEEYALEHFGYDSLSEFISRNNRYSTVEAENLDAEGVEYSFFEMIWQAKREFLRRFIWHQGFRDGFWGFALSFLMAFYKLTVWVKLWQIQKS